MPRTVLSKRMSLQAFENGYRYATIALNSLERFARIPHPRYINFLADYFAANRGASRDDAIVAWKELKDMNVPKTFDAWRKITARRRRRR